MISKQGSAPSSCRNGLLESAACVCSVACVRWRPFVLNREKKHSVGRCGVSMLLLSSPGSRRKKMEKNVGEPLEHILYSP